MMLWSTEQPAQDSCFPQALQAQPFCPALLCWARLEGREEIRGGCARERMLLAARKRGFAMAIPSLQ